MRTRAERALEPSLLRRSIVASDTGSSQPSRDARSPCFTAQLTLSHVARVRDCLWQLLLSEFEPGKSNEAMFYPLSSVFFPSARTRARDLVPDEPIYALYDLAAVEGALTPDWTTMYYRAKVGRTKKTAPKGYKAVTYVNTDGSLSHADVPLEAWLPGEAQPFPTLILPASVNSTHIMHALEALRPGSTNLAAQPATTAAAAAAATSAALTPAAAAAAAAVTPVAGAAATPSPAVAQLRVPSPAALNVTPAAPPAAAPAPAPIKLIVKLEKPAAAPAAAPAPVPAATPQPRQPSPARRVASPAVHVAAPLAAVVAPVAPAAPAAVVAPVVAPPPVPAAAAAAPSVPSAALSVDIHKRKREDEASMVDIAGVGVGGGVSGGGGAVSGRGDVSPISAASSAPPSPSSYALSKKARKAAKRERKQSSSAQADGPTAAAWNIDLPADPRLHPLLEKWNVESLQFVIPALKPLDLSVAADSAAPVATASTVVKREEPAEAAAAVAANLPAEPPSTMTEHPLMKSLELEFAQWHSLQLAKTTSPSAPAVAAAAPSATPTTTAPLCPFIAYRSALGSTQYFDQLKWLPEKQLSVAPFVLDYL